MSLKFIIGEPGSGKSYLMTEQVKTLAESGAEVTVIVPEQFSSASEHRLYNVLGIALYNRIKVETFTRIRRAVLKKGGGSSANLPTEAAKAAVMYEVRRRLARAEGELKTFGRQVKNSAFTSVCLDMVRELEMNGIAAADLDHSKIEDAALAAKIGDIKRICGEYDMLLTEAGYSASAAVSEEAADAAAKTRFFEGGNIFIDGFKSFTADQLRIIGIMKSQCPVTVCLPTPYDTPNSSPVFGSVNETMEDIRRGGDAEIIRVTGGEGRFAAAPDIGRLSRSVLRGEDAASFEAKHIHIAEAPDVPSETDYICADIARRVRTGEYTCRDIAVLSRDFENVRGALEDSFLKYDIPYFMDSPVAAASKPFSIFVMTVAEAASSEKPSAEMLLRIMKTGFTAVQEQHISELEAYYTEHGIEKESFKSSPICDNAADVTYDILCKYDGTATNGEETYDDLSAAADLTPAQRAEIIRRTVTEPLRVFAESCGDTLKSITAALCDAVNALGGGNNDEETFQDREGEQITSLISDLLNNISNAALPESCDKFTVKEYRDILGQVLAKTSLSAPARTISCVTAASSDRARLDSPKLVYIMSAENGFFPFAVSESGIFSERELEILEDALGLRFNERLSRTAAEENFIAVNAIAAPSHELMITYSLTDSSGKAAYPSSLAETCLELTDSKLLNISEVPAAKLAVTPRSVYSQYVRKPGLSGSEAAAAMRVYGEGFADKMISAADYRRSIARGDIYKAKLTEDTALKLYTGKKGALSVSASRLEDEVKCPFLFFCKKGLNIYPTKKYEYSSAVRGTAVHDILRTVLQEILRESEEQHTDLSDLISSYTEKGFKELIHSAADSIYKETYGSGFEAKPSFEKSFYYQEKVILDILLHTQREYAAEGGGSRFVPAEFEFPIGLGERGTGMPPLRFTAETKEKQTADVTFYGAVDRIDVFRDESGEDAKNYLRVVDYKTGKKAFDLKNLAEGLDMQMLLYLNAVTNENSPYKGYLPAGVMYSPSRPVEGEKRDHAAVNAEEAGVSAVQNADKKLKMSGVTLNDVNIIRAMEFRAEGKFIPAELDLENALKYLDDLAKEAAKLSDCGKILYGCGAAVGDGTLKIQLTAELFRSCGSDPRTAADDIGRRLSLDKDLTDRCEKALESTKALATDSKFIQGKENFLSAYELYTDFDKNIKDAGNIRAELENAFKGEKCPDPKTALTEKEYRNLVAFAENKVKELASDICSGKADMTPLLKAKPCDLCDYRSICANGVPDLRNYKRSVKDAAAVIDDVLGRTKGDANAEEGTENKAAPQKQGRRKADDAAGGKEDK